MKKLNALSEESCTELIATTKRRKLTEHEQSINVKLAMAKELKGPTVAVEEQHRTHSKGKGDMEI